MRIVAYLFFATLASCVMSRLRGTNAQKANARKIEKKVVIKDGHVFVPKGLVLTANERLLLDGLRRRLCNWENTTTE